MLKTIKKYLQDQLLELRDVLEPATVQAVRDYIMHAEYELAFEGLMLDIMQLPIAPTLDYALAWKHAVTLGLDVDSTIDDEFGRKFALFVSANGCNKLPNQHD